MRRGTLPKGVSHEGRRKGFITHTGRMELVAPRVFPRTHAKPVENVAAEERF